MPNRYDKERFLLSSRELYEFAAFPSIVTERNNQAFVVSSFQSKSVQPDKREKEESRNFEKSLIGSLLFNTHVPAIPSHNRKYGYGETSDGSMFPFECPIKMYSGNKLDSVNY